MPSEIRPQLQTAGQGSVVVVDASPTLVYAAGMRPLDVQQIGNELAIKWETGQESFISLEKLRRACPCAGCKGEMDVLGNLHKLPDRPLPPNAFTLIRVDNVGGYALQPVWADGHATGLYSFEYLQALSGNPA
ncbi:MAG TPA: DUF971 domain-containing protein [Clostridia bacterium]|nr:DUF971 domain-containing protein [Clostridia bacterium]